ncbi:MAG: DUF4268 domain-containing protein [Planctomycetales bacterium]
MTTNMGRLERVDLREAWASEAAGFTPWLARPENIALLGDSIGIGLEVESQETCVGAFRADILCKDTANGSFVLIENQLERTDHGHLGQLITYAAGLEAVTIVWIAQRFTEEHRAALDWLNEVTGQEIRLFGLEVELWRIADSPVAPKFNVVSSPNDWTKTLKRNDRTIRHPERLEYWTAFRDRLLELAPDLKPPKATDAASLDMAIGRRGIRAKVGIYVDEGRMFVRLPDLGKALLPWRDEIETAMGMTTFAPGKLGNPNIEVSREAEFSDRESWENQHVWLIEEVLRFRDVLVPKIEELGLLDDATEEPSS